MLAGPGEETSGVPRDGYSNRMAPGLVRFLRRTTPSDPDCYSDPFPTITLVHIHNHDDAHAFPDAFPHA
jgi:hypothetical protein